MDQESKRRVLWWMMIPLGLLFLFALSGWPLSVLMGYCTKHQMGGAVEFLRLLRRPHFVVGYYSENYYNMLSHGVTTGLGFEREDEMGWQIYRYFEDHPDDK